MYKGIFFGFNSQVKWKYIISYKAWSFLELCDRSHRVLLDLFNKKKWYRCLTKCILPPHVYSADYLNCKCHSWYVFFSQTNFFIVSINIYVIFSPLSKINFVRYFSNTLKTHYFVQLIFFFKNIISVQNWKKPFTADVLIRVLFWMQTIWSLCVTEWKWKVHREVLFLSFRGAASYEHFGVEWFYFVILCFEGQGRDLPLTRVWNDP